jgi:D-tyrosyl-tRNA(Tyr) deacylase
MRVVIQRVNRASVTIGGNVKSSIGQGLLVLAGFEYGDGNDDLEWIANKITQLRVFDDEKGVMNLSVKDINGELLVVSQFTLHAKTKKGNRPSYINAAPPGISVPLYNDFVKVLASSFGKEIQTGEFGAMMMVDLVNDGPVTIIMDSKKKDL